MPFPGTFGTALSTVLSGQESSNQDRAAYNAQVQQRQLEDQLRRAQLMMQLQDASATRAAMSSLPPDQQRALQLGEPYADIQKRQAVSGRINQWKSTIGQALIDPDRPLDQKKKLLQIYGSIDENTDPGDLEKQLKDFAGLGVKESPQPFQHFTADGKVQAFEGYDPTGKPKIQTLGAAPAETKLTAHWVSESDDFGKPVTVKYLSDAAGNTVSRTVEGRGKLSPQESRLLDSTGSAERTMGKLQQDLAAIKDSSPLTLGLQYAKYRAPFGAGGAVDPAYSAYFNDLGQLQTDLVGAATSGSSRSYQLIDMLKPHIPSPTDPPARALEKMKGFEMGRFKAAREAILGTGAPVDPFSSGSTPSGTPVYDTAGKIIGYTTDGKTMTPVGR